MGKLFISHSSKNKNLIDKFILLCTSVGVSPDNIFCSSFEGQGVKNGTRINSEITREINESEAIVYIITKDFINSAYCAQELGAVAFLNENKPFFIFKSNELNNNDLSGFIDSSIKYNLFNTEGVSEFCDWLSSFFGITKKMATINKAISKFLEDAKEDITILIENKDKTEKELQKERISFLESQYEDLPIGAKRIIAEIYFSEDGVGYYSLNNGTVGLLQSQFFIARTTTVSTGLVTFAFALQPWVRDFIKKHSEVREELSKIVKSKRKMYRDGDDY